MGILDDFLGWVSRNNLGPGPTPQGSPPRAAQSPTLLGIPSASDSSVQGPPSPEMPYGKRGQYIDSQAAAQNPYPQPQPAPTPTVPIDVLQSAVATAKTRYPRLASYPIALTTGKGPYESETFAPTDKDNPLPGKWNIQLRSAQSMSNPSLLPDTVASEMQHALYANDPRFKNETDNFVKSMTPGQLRDSKRTYQKEKIDSEDETKVPPFEQWLPKVQAQEYIRGHLFPNVNPGWTGPEGDGQYTPQQMKQLTALKAYMLSNDAK